MSDQATGPTAHLRCAELVAYLDDLYHLIAPEGKPDGFFNVVFWPLWAGEPEPADGAAFVGLWADPINAVRGPERRVETDSAARMALTFAASAYCVQAMKADIAGDTTAAWGFACQASRWFGTLTGLLNVQALGPMVAAWHLRPVKRDRGLNKTLWETLERHRAAGLRKPTALDVLKEWTEKQPDDVVRVSLTEVVMHEGEGKEKRYFLSHVQDQIKNLTKVEVGSGTKSKPGDKGK